MDAHRVACQVDGQWTGAPLTDSPIITWAHARLSRRGDNRPAARGSKLTLTGGSGLPNE